ncbi:MAG: hypothetical protein Q4D85_01145 [Corynebacterium sp.]|uniref:hypothetical protein n=1 Tax=Corynebacterium sp. TaxID=1720 RepID=UPI0026DC9F0E|nr:hypothetical protein [Corynebacterium sp.]MDO5097334.1 hypothetical protein [Corynebacterium sp.]
MPDRHPIFHDVERRAVAATIIEENGQRLLVLDLLHEDGSSSRILTLNDFDAHQLLSVCQQYVD